MHLIQMLVFFGSAFIKIESSSNSDRVQRQTQVCDTGVEQSPVNIFLTPFQPLLTIPTIFLVNKNYNTLGTHKFLAQYNGIAGAQFAINPTVSNTSTDLIFSGLRLQNKYRLARIHFHWGENDTSGSEHTINSVSYPLEMHMVHHKTTYSSLTDAVASEGDRDAITVIGVFFEISPFPNIVLNPIFNALSLLKKAREPTPVEALMKASDIFPKQLDFVRYLGSLTTGNCQEAVLWNVLLHPLKISADQIAGFRRLSSKTGTFVGNNRQTYPLNGRSLEFLRAKGVYWNKIDEFNYTNIGQLILDFPSIFFSGLVSLITKFLNI